MPILPLCGRRRNVIIDALVCTEFDVMASGETKHLEDLKLLRHVSLNEKDIGSCCYGTRCNRIALAK